MSVEYEVGRTYWFQGLNRNRSEEVTVESIGRKWVNLSNRFRVEKGKTQADGAGYCSPGRIWDSRDEQEDWEKRNSRWRLFQELIRYKNVPDNLTDEDLDWMFRKVRHD